MFDKKDCPRFFKVSELPAGCKIWDKKKLLGTTKEDLPVEYYSYVVSKFIDADNDYQLLWEEK